ncbi:MAG: FxLYD domain-containing protein [Candidatus Bathyarchaeota archaeon]|nr:FxLYD domain-containing protein [Candidatus Bathyarchaeota archaeon]
MKKLTACLLVFFVAASLSITLVPNGASQASTVKIVSYSYYVDTLGYLDVVGEIQNNGPNTLDQVVVSGTVTTTDGQELTSSIKAWGFQLKPGQKAPFYLEFHSQGSTDGTFTGTVADVSLSISEAPATAKYQYPDITITSHHPTLTAVGEYFADCQIKNTGSQTATSVIVSATFYNSTGQVVAVGYSNQTDLAPGATAFLRAGAFDLNQTSVPSGQKIDSYSLRLQLSAPLLEGSAPVDVPTPTPGPAVVETPGPDSGSSGPDNNNGGGDSTGVIGIDQSTNLAIGIVVVVVVVVAALLLLTRRRKPKPAATLPAAKSAGGKAKRKHK